MKIIKIILVLFAGFFLSNCSDDDEVAYESQFSNLEQTSWKGTLISEVGEEITDSGKADILFLTEEHGNSIVVKNGLIQKWGFGYVVNNKLLTISRPDPNSYNEHFLEGDWILIHEEKDRLVFEQALVDNKYLKMTLDITRVY